MRVWYCSQGQPWLTNTSHLCTMCVGFAGYHWHWQNYDQIIETTGEVWASRCQGGQV